MIEGYATNQVIANRYPGISQVKVANVLDGLKSVSLKNADAFIGDLGSITFILSKNSVTDIKLTEEVWFLKSKDKALHVGVVKEKTILRDILQKGLDSISNAELNAIRQRWLPFTLGSKKFDIASMLTAEEIQWLSKHQNFRLGVDPAWAPFEFFDDEGNYSGIGSSYTKTIGKRLNVTMKPLQGLSWSEVMTKAKAGEVDILPTVMRTKPREKYLNFTEPYISLPIIIATRKDSPFIDSLSDLAGVKVGVVEGYATIDLLKQDYPSLNLINYKTLSEGLVALNDGNIEAFVDNLGTITYEVDRNKLSNIKIAAPTEYNFELSMGVRKDWPELVGILNKILASMSDEEHRSIKNSWIALEVKLGFDLKTILIWAIPIGASVVLIVFFVLVWNRRLGIEITERKQAEEALRESRATARGLLDATQESLLLLDKEGIIIAVNQTAARRHQRTPEEIIGINRFDILPQSLRESRKVHFDNVLKTGNPSEFEDMRDGIVFAPYLLSRQG